MKILRNRALQLNFILSYLVLVSMKGYAIFFKRPENLHLYLLISLLLIGVAFLLLLPLNTYLNEFLLKKDVLLTRYSFLVVTPLLVSLPFFRTFFVGPTPVLALTLMTVVIFMIHRNPELKSQKIALPLGLIPLISFFTFTAIQLTLLVGQAYAFKTLGK